MVKFTLAEPDPDILAKYILRIDYNASSDLPSQFAEAARVGYTVHERHIQPF